MPIRVIIVDLGGVLLEIVDWRKWERCLNLAKGDLMKFAATLEEQAQAQGKSLSAQELALHM